MAGKVAKLLDFRLGSFGTPTTLVDVSGKISDVKINRGADTPEVTAFNGSGAKDYAAGLTEGSFSVDFFYDATLDTHLNGLLGYDTPVNFQYGGLGAATGLPKKTGACLLKKLDDPRKVGDVMKFSAEFQVSGPIASGTY
jgi:hypothetical protein